MLYKPIKIRYWEIDFFVEGRHLVIDAVMTTVYMNTVLEKVATIPGFAAKHAEDRKLFADRTSTQPIGGARRPPHFCPLCDRRWRPPRRPCPGPATFPGDGSTSQREDTPLHPRSRKPYPQHADIVVGPQVAAAPVSMGTLGNFSPHHAPPLPSSGGSAQPHLG
jgi:hypothetical protein